MKKNQGFKVATRIQALVALTLIGLLVLCVSALLQLKNSMLEDRKVRIKSLVEIATGVLNHYHRQVGEGKLSEEEAKIRARNTLRELRYQQGDYFFGVDTQGNYILMPTKPEWEGQNKIDLKDARGTPLIRELINAANRGGDFVHYWFVKPGQTQDEPKLSYSTLFTPWNWVIGTGIYIDDIDTAYRKDALLLGGMSLVLLILVAGTGWQLGRSIVRQLGGEPADAVDVMQRIASGDLTTRIQAPAGSLLNALSDMTQSLHQMVSEINNDANRVANNATQIANASERVNQAAGRQTDATAAMAAAIEELTVSSTHISDSARDTSHYSHEAVTLSAQGSERVQQASNAIGKIATTVSDASARIRALEERAQQVSSIANVIKEIAGQTNLLALNAAIEAARAGEQGRGFAVVADEVGKLADRTSLATTEIEEMIAGIQKDTAGAVLAMNTALPEVQEGVALSMSASESLATIKTGAEQTLDRIAEVANATEEQSSASTSIAQRVEQIANMVEESSHTVRETASTAHELEHVASNLKQLVSRFRI